MEQSILTSTKKLLNVAETYTVFDLDIIMHINATFANLNQLGIGPELGFIIEDSSAVWGDLLLPLLQLSLVKQYIYVKVKALFDPHITSFHIDSADRHIQEIEWRLSVFREDLIPLPPKPEPILESPYVYWQ